LPDALFFTDLETMLERVKPAAVAAFTSTYDHPQVVEACARRHVHVMMEKPLAVGVEHARRIERASASGAIHVIVNYETTWYRSPGALWKLIKEERVGGDIRKMVAMDGHQGPKETASTTRPPSSSSIRRRRESSRRRGTGPSTARTSTSTARTGTRVRSAGESCACAGRGRPTRRR
jgi:predicted dehydrogenase